MASKRGRASSASIQVDRSRAGTATDDREARRHEESCILKCLEGDPEAFRPLVERYSPALHTFINRMVNDREDAREITQEVFARAYRNLVDFNPRYRFSTWLYTIALNLCRDHMRHSRRTLSEKRVDMDVGLLMVIDPVEQRLDVKRRYQALLACLDRLPPKYREVLVMKDVMMLPYREIQKAMHLPVPLLKIRVVRARRKLCSMITAMEQGERKT
jgi:RNA polymerase sigma-70 factor (ECF subfamily)